MKILELRFKNLNSLVGEWLIDFQNDSFLENGIFAITGSTGAGKTTILDAITLALYGQTARLGEITEGSNEIMSRHTGECYSELCFETKKGKFRVNWSQRRSRKKADGKLQTPKHEIVNEFTGEIIEANKLKEVKKTVIDKIGMNFEQFTRSILLAQGSFSAFLQASQDERAPILEQITGTEIYSQISLRVHERKKEEQLKLQSLEDQLSGIKLLTDEEVKDLEKVFSEKESEEKDLGNQYRQLSAELNQLKECKSLQEEKQKLENYILDYSSKLKEKDLSQKETSLKKEDIEKKRVDFDEFKKAEISKIKTLRDFDFKIDEKTRSLLKLKNEFSELKTDIAKNESDKKTLETRTKEASNKQAKLEDFLKSNLNLRELEACLPKLRNILDNLKKNKAEISKSELSKMSLEKELMLARKEFTTIEQSYKAFETKKDLLVVEINRFEDEKKLKFKDINLEDLRIKLEAVSLSFEIKKIEKSKEETVKSLDLLAKDFQSLNEKKKILEELCLQLEKNREQELKIISLEKERAKLIQGEECPLCGSLEHPFVSDDFKLEDSKSDLEEKKNELKQVQENHSKFLVEISAFEKELEVYNSNINNYSYKLDSLKISSELKAKLVDASIHELENEIIDLKTALERLDKLDQQISLKNKELRNLEAEYQQSSQERDSVKERGMKLKTDFSHLEEYLNKLQQESESCVTEFHKILIDLDSKQDSTQDIERKFKDLESLLNALQEKEAELNNLKIQVKENILKEEALDKSIKVLSEKLLVKEKEVIEQESLVSEIKEKRYALAENTSVEELEANLENKESALYRLEKEISEKIHSIEKDIELIKLNIKNNQDRSNDVKETLSKMNLEVFQDADLEEKETEINSKLSLISKLNQELGIIKEKLDANKAAKAEMSEKALELDKQKKELERFNLLHELIGSADGKKFRNFAQGLSFEIMIAQANKQLQKMTDRYILIRDDKNNLALNILDNYQAGEIRSTKNLSGGESFIVSLALALGLSKMASANVQVDSLFLDEGFGTLDEEALETALTVLSSLKDDGKLIGVISHIPALKDRIPVQIKLESSSLGRSRISGLGVQRLHENLVS